MRRDPGIKRADCGTSTLQGVSEVTTYRMREPTRVLVADSDPSTGRLLISIGEKEGYTVVTVEDGREAYRVLKSDGNFKAAVFDMTMPHLEGVEIVRYMKTEKRLMGIPVVVLAGAQGLNPQEQSQKNRLPDVTGKLRD